MTASTLSDRGAVLLTKSIRFTFGDLLSDLYDPKTNPNGTINMGTAENYVMNKEVSDFANRKLVETNETTFTYGEGPWGTKRLRRGMARHMNKHFHPVKPVEPDEIVFTNGITSVFEILGFTIAEAGDGILTSQPCYQAFETDWGNKAEVKCVYTPFHGVDGFSPAAVEKYEQALLKSESEGTKIRALLLCHPHNPLGQCYPQETIIGLMKLCQKYKIHLLADEVYALSVYDVPDKHAVKFRSVLSFDSSEYMDQNYLHVLYGFSKDFASGGLRIGCIQTKNKELVDAVSSITQFHWVGSLEQMLAVSMLEDEAWSEQFFAKSQKSLAEKNVLCRKILDEHDIEYAKGANAGFFLWVSAYKTRHSKCHCLQSLADQS